MLQTLKNSWVDAFLMTEKFKRKVLALEKINGLKFFKLSFLKKNIDCLFIKNEIKEIKRNKSQIIFYILCQIFLYLEINN